VVIILTAWRTPQAKTGVKRTGSQAGINQITRLSPQKEQCDTCKRVFQNAGARMTHERYTTCRSELRLSLHQFGVAYGLTYINSAMVGTPRIVQGDTITAPDSVTVPDSVLQTCEGMFGLGWCLPKKKPQYRFTEHLTADIVAFYEKGADSGSNMSPEAMLRELVKLQKDKRKDYHDKELPSAYQIKCKINTIHQQRKKRLGNSIPDVVAVPQETNAATQPPTPLRPRTDTVGSS
jgi:hypothetical protein